MPAAKREHLEIRHLCTNNKGVTLLQACCQKDVAGDAPLLQKLNVITGAIFNDQMSHLSVKNIVIIICSGLMRPFYTKTPKYNTTKYSKHFIILLHNNVSKK